MPVVLEYQADECSMEDRWHVVYGGQVACSVWRTGGM